MADPPMPTNTTLEGLSAIGKSISVFIAASSIDEALLILFDMFVISIAPIALGSSSRFILYVPCPVCPILPTRCLVWT